jgi:hypothetical protein
MAGGAYYFIEDGGVERVIQNAHYTASPPLNEIEKLAGSRFVPPDDLRPLWSSFVEEPQRYAFITDPDAAQTQFIPGDQSL